jgi:hypothetical protein
MPEPNSHIDDSYAIKTWRYLRLAMVALALGLLAPVLYEHAQTHCFQHSISAYWYTPARSYFVGMLTGMSVCLVCLRGSDPAEDILLNYAGMFAAVVAFVPTPPEKCPACTQVASAHLERAADIANNGTALFALAGVIVAIALLIWRREAPTKTALRWFSVALAIVLAALGLFVFARDTFAAGAHLTAAGLMFACIIAVVWVNAFASQPCRRVLNYRNAYLGIAIAMATAVVATIAVAVFSGWSHLTIWIEAVLITLFAIFWVLQTIELWGPGLRLWALPPSSGHCRPTARPGEE